MRERWLPILVFSVTFMVVLPNAHAQTAHEGILFSQDDIVGTARFNALGGAFSALGGDWAGAHQNPAGLGVYRSNEFSISPALHFNLTEGNYHDNPQLDNKVNFNFGNLSIVGVQPVRKSGKWRSTSIGIGLSRSASYHRNFSGGAQQVNTSMLTDFANILNENDVAWQDLNSGDLFPFDIWQAWYNFLIDTLPGGIGFRDTLGGTPTNHSYSSEASGAKRETYFSVGANYDDRLYLGAGLSISRIVYERETLFSEWVPDPGEPLSLSQYSFSSRDVYNGRGVALNAGVIYRPVDPLRIGLSARTPTWYSFEYDFTSSMNATYANGDFYLPDPAPEGSFNFRMRTPWKATLGLAYIIGKLGLISADVEYIDYSSTRFSNAAGETAGRDFLNQLNDEMTAGLRPVLNYRFGGEYRISQFYSARAGFAHYSNPYEDDIDNNGSFQVASVGFGFRDDFYSIDVAGQYRMSEDRVYLYDPELAQPLDVTAADYRITLTFGFRF